MNKTCPKCEGTNTAKASKLGFYAGSRFCRDCAIYYNMTREEYLKALDVVTEYNKQLRIGGVMPSWREFYHRRKQLGLSMQDVTNCTRVSKATISRLEKGKEVYYSNLESIHKFYLSNEA